MMLMRRNRFSSSLGWILVVVCLTILVVPAGSLARVDYTNGRLGEEGDPLDSNDYSSGGGGGGDDSDVHDTLSTDVDDTSGLIRVFFMADARMLVVSWIGNVPVVQIVSRPVTDSAVDSNAD